MSYVFSDFAKTTLSGPINGNQIPLKVGGGDRFPSPGPGQSFKVILIDQATGNVKEIVEIGARQGDVLTIIGRGQEGTGQQDWQSGDTAMHAVTADALNGFLQKSQYQGPGAIVWHYSLDVSGQANVIDCPGAADTIGVLGGLLTAPAVTNTGPTVINDGSGTIFPLLRQDGMQLVKGDILANAPIACVKDNQGNYRLIGFAQNEVQRIVVNPRLYVDPNAGDDNSTGGQGNPFRTITAALAYAATQLFSPGGITIQLAVPNAVYDCPHYVGYVSGPVTINGDPNNIPAYVLTSSANDFCILSFTGQLTLNGLVVNNTSGSASTLICGSGKFIIGNVVLQAIQGTTGVVMQCNPGGNFSINDKTSFEGNHAVWIYANGGNFGMGNLPNSPNVTISFVGNPAYTTLIVVGALCQVDLLSSLAFNGGVQCNQQWSVGPLGLLAGVMSGRQAGFLPGSSQGNTKDALGVVN